MKSKPSYVKLLHTLLICFSLTLSNVVFGQVLLNSSFEGTNPFAGFVNNQSCCSYSVTASTNHPHSGTQSFRSEVRVGDPSVSSGWRAELTTSGISDQGNMWYGFSVYFETPTSGQYWTGSYGGHFIQWHPNNGSGSAELAIYGSEGLWDVTVNPSGGAGGTHQSTTASGGPLKKITANVWHDVVFHVQWGSGGMVEVWIDGELYFTKSGLNWAANAYLKFGMNRWGNCSGAPCDTWVIYYDNIKIGRDVTYNDVAPTATAPGNIAPTANAGNNITIGLPTTITTLNGSGTDPDGTISSYSWSKVSGPTGIVPLLGSATSAITALTGLTGAGTYVYRLTVTDNSGATATDDVTVTVNPLINLAPTANAGTDQTLTLPTNSTTLTGSGTDPDGTIASYAWARVSGPTTFTLGSAGAATTTLTGLVAGTYVFRLTVTDNGGTTATDNVTIVVNAAPQPPTANAGANITLTLPVNSTTLTGSGNDPDGTIASYDWARVSGPTTFTLGNAGASSTSLTGLVAGVYVFRLTVTDNSGMTATDDITVTVNPAANQLPTANAGNNITITLPTNSVTLNGSGADADGTISGYAWTRVSGPTTYAFGSANAASTTATGLVAGTYVFRLTVTDNNGGTGFDDVTVTVNAAANQLPSANAGNNIVITLPTNSTTLNGTGTDPDGTITTYAWTRVSGPTTYAFGSANASSTTVTGLVQGTYTFRLTVTDNSGATATDDVNVTVNPSPGPANQAPIANAGTNITINLPVNSTSLNGSGSIDLDGTISTYAWTWVSGPTTFTMGTPNSATTTLTGLVQGVYVFRLTVTDNGGSTDIDNIVVTVNAAANQVPSANAGNNITLTLPTNSTTLNGVGTDLDGTISTYAWTRVSGPTTFTMGTAGAATTSLTGLVAGTYVFRLTVTDNSGATATDDVIVTVNPAVVANQPPVARAGNDIVMTLPTNATTLNGNTSTDADGTIVSYSWSRVSGPTTYTFSSAGSAATGLNNLVAGVYVFRLTVTDNSGASSTDDITVTVNAAANQPPVANAGNDITITLPVNSTTLAGSGTDPDGTITGYAWARVSGPTTYTFGNASAATTALTGLVQGVYVFRLTVTDNNGITGTDNITVVVNPANAPSNQTPTANAGADRTITLPVNTTTLTGSGTDPDGTIVAYSWTRVSGPATFLLSNGSAATTPLSNLVQGVYVFRLTVTDNYGATATDNVTVTVNAAVPGANQPPVARTTVDSIVLVLPDNATALNGSTSTDADGIIATYAWIQLSGPTTATINSAGSAIAQVSGLTLGVYTFQLKVTDDDGASSTRAVKVVVKNANGQGRYFNLYPNPAKNNITLQYYENGNGKYRISIYDATRKLVRDGFVDKNQVTLTETMNVDNLKNGIYFIQMVLPDGKTIAKQFVKM
jgi:ribosomal protein L14